MSSTVKERIRNPFVSPAGCHLPFQGRHPLLNTYDQKLSFAKGSNLTAFRGNQKPPLKALKDWLRVGEVAPPKAGSEGFRI